MSDEGYFFRWVAGNATLLFGAAAALGGAIFGLGIDRAKRNETAKAVKELSKEMNSMREDLHKMTRAFDRLSGHYQATHKVDLRE